MSQSNIRRDSRKRLLANLSLNCQPIEIRYSPRSKHNVKLNLASGTEASGVCLECHDTPCVQFNKAQVDINGVLNEFAKDKSLDICPVKAIRRLPKQNVPAINSDQCIGCGICISRCPYGAISFTKEKKAFINLKDVDGITSRHMTESRNHEDFPKIGLLGNTKNVFLSDFPKLVKNLDEINRIRLLRNFLLLLDTKIITPRRGDVNLRMSGLIEFPSGKIGVVEMAHEESSLEAPRYLLEHIAILHSRYDIPKERMVPISILVRMPNKRSEYYNVVEDIQHALDIECMSITCGVVIMLSWRFGNVNDFVSVLHPTATKGENLLTTLQSVSGEWSKEPYDGAFRPTK